MDGEQRRCRMHQCRSMSDSKTTLHCPSIQNPQVQFSCKDMKKALELFMDVADTKPKHKALGTNGKGCRENLRSSISIYMVLAFVPATRTFVTVRSEVGVKYRGNRTRTYPYMSGDHIYIIYI